jgi:hypothetical protein
MTITFRLEKELEAAVKARVEALGVTVTDYVRAAVEEKLRHDLSPASVTPTELWDRLGVEYDSGETDRSERIEAILRQRFSGQSHRG